LGKYNHFFRFYQPVFVGLFAVAGNEQVQQQCAFFLGFQGTNVGLPTNVSFLDKILDLHICPQKKAMNALPNVHFIF